MESEKPRYVPVYLDFPRNVFSPHYDLTVEKTLSVVVMIMNPFQKVYFHKNGKMLVRNNILTCDRTDAQDPTMRAVDYNPTFKAISGQNMKNE